MDQPEPGHRTVQEAHRENTDSLADTPAGEDKLPEVGTPEVAGDMGPER